MYAYNDRWFPCAYEVYNIKRYSLYFKAEHSVVNKRSFIRSLAAAVVCDEKFLKDFYEKKWVVVTSFIFPSHQMKSEKVLMDK